jgi:hypothetical protein
VRGKRLRDEVQAACSDAIVLFQSLQESGSAETLTTPANYSAPSYGMKFSATNRRESISVSAKTHFGYSVKSCSFFVTPQLVPKLPPELRVICLSSPHSQQEESHVYAPPSSSNSARRKNPLHHFRSPGMRPSLRKPCTALRFPNSQVPDLHNMCQTNEPGTSPSKTRHVGGITGHPPRLSLRGSRRGFLPRSICQ